mmetsp:Transcript_65621/g.182520  ORF Transcript_65621/g.182520 Transcript_65621/m.182520 type:complete len:476 (+) Transcript_65621:99-1526(+)|eukprot:CAMPEP_0117537854 /NCGR_PEP_ID=MMETSP0784-20121206/42182_1 /TAXON_ID=39447 /ORGANISM="" /LENGTH=475 /DNA_ID=CAMNT_0005334459 /DNA_START=93 /DNA_END=1520 /DNA_ORIENTATION=+
MTTGRNYGAATSRLVVMSWCFNLLADFLWIPFAAYAHDLSLSATVIGSVFAINLGSRLVPNLAVMVFGTESEFAMMTCVILGYACSMLWPGETWSFSVMAVGSGMCFVRACLCLHPQAAFGSDGAQLERAGKLCGAARNFGSIVALVAPVVVYKEVGWPAVCAVAIGVATLYMVCAAIQHCSAAPIEEEPSTATLTPAKESGLHSECCIPWIDWVISALFVVLELLFNLSNSATPITLVRTFGVKISTAGFLLASFNAVSMVFLGLVPTMPWALLRKNPLNLLFSSLCIAGALCIAMVASACPENGLHCFVSSILLFVVAGFFKQVLLLEYLTGVPDARGAERLLGVTETLGCGLAMAGGYLGDALETYGAAAPFALQASVGLLAFVVLVTALGCRGAAQLSARGAASTAPWQGFLREGIFVFKAMSTHGSFISSEREFRRHRSEPLLNTDVGFVSSEREFRRHLSEPLLNTEAV